MDNHRLLTIAKYSVLEAVRDKFLIFILAGVFGFFIISLFIGELTVTEGAATQATLLASALRLYSVFTVSLFVISSMTREFNDKGFELILSHPVPRASYYFGKFIGFSIVALIISFFIFVCLSIHVPIISAGYWSFSLFCELLIIIAMSLLCLFSFNSITISFTVVMSFYFLSRSMEIIQLISNSPILALGSPSHQFISSMLDYIAYLLPGLYSFTKSEWLIYQANILSELNLVIGQTFIYITFISAVALFDLYRKEL